MSKKDKKGTGMKEKYFSLASLFLFLLSFALRYQGVLSDTLSSLLIVVVLFAGAVFLLKHAKKSPSLSDIISLGVVYLLSFVDKSAVLNQTLYGLVQPLLFALVGFFLLRIFDISLEYKGRDIKKIAIIVGVSLLFAYLFLLLNEPFPGFIRGSLFLLIIYTFFVSLGEELVFRGVSFSLIRNAFSLEQAMHVQAGLFTFIHLVSIGTLYQFYKGAGSLLLESAGLNVFIYAVALYGFAIIAARQAIGEKKTNILYPVLFHWLVNFFNLLVLIF
ncbi:MAG: CPBP family intramembrane metalloprotease [Nanoarchaeota archaeon]|nr:CPBP family intramembrane metalloprotease [Nanoarchaeota archaeon]